MAAGSGLHISVSAEPIFTIGGVTVTNSIFTTWIVTALLIWFALSCYSKFNKVNFGDKPSRFQSFVEMIVEALYNLVKSIAGSHKKARIFFPIIATFFVFILLSNWSGLLPGFGTIGFREKEKTQVDQVVQVDQVEPFENTQSEQVVQVIQDEHGEEIQATENEGEEVVGVELEENEHEESKFVPYFRGPTADLNTTLALAIVSMVTVQVLGFRFLGVSYGKKFFNLKSPIDFFIGILELVSDISKIISFAFRLFGNVFAGEVLLAVMAFLMPVFAPLPFLGLEVFVGFVQALVFAMLSLVFMNMATMGHGEEH